MNRRDFLRTSISALLIPFVPASALANTPTDLKSWFESNFNCKKGPQSSKVKVGNKNYIYETFVAGVLDGSEQEAKQRLTNYFVTKFAPLAIDKPDLWWRVEPRFESGDLIEYGKTWMTAEEVEDSGVRGDKFFKPVLLRNHPRKWTPMKWVEVQKPDDVEMDFETGAYKYVVAKHTFYKMRFRLAIPAFTQQLETFAHVEGNLSRKI